MKVVVVGTRGIPDIPGGVETHCQQLYPRLVELGCDVTVIRRSCYVSPSNRMEEYRGVKLIDVYAPRKKSFEAFVHTALAIVKARRLRPDLIHCHAVGPSVVLPLARLLGMRVVATHHGPDYNRAKWNAPARFIIKWGEWCQARLAHHVIAISRPIVAALDDDYERRERVHLIYNGVEPPPADVAADCLARYGLEPERYVLAVGRFVPEKRFDWLVKAFARVAPQGLKLVLAGDADHDDDYARALKRLAHDHGAVLTGYVTGEPLRQLQRHARLFVLPSTHEGLPISLLEAMSHGRDVLVSDIDANRLSQLGEDDFFHTHDMDDFVARLRSKLERPVDERQYDLTDYDWDHIARQTLKVYHDALDPR